MNLERGKQARRAYGRLLYRVAVMAAVLALVVGLVSLAVADDPDRSSTIVIWTLVAGVVFIIGWGLRLFLAGE